MWEGNSIKEQMALAHKDKKYLSAETLYRRMIVENLLGDSAGYTPDANTLDMLVFLEIKSMLEKAE